MHKQASIFIAGHLGLIGAACLRHFTARGFTNLITRTHDELDLCDKNSVDAFFKEHKPDYVIMSSGKVGGIVENQRNPAEFMTTNLAMQNNVFAAAQANGAKRVLFFGSSCMYPREAEQPMREEMLLTGKPEPTSLAYAIAKLAGVQLALSYNAQYGTTLFLPVIPNSVYGPNDNFDPMTGHVLSALITRFHEAKMQGAKQVPLWGTGAPKREFLFADDLAEACAVVLCSDSPTLPINIGSGYEVSIRELAEKIAQLVGYSGELVWDKSRPDGAPRKLLDSNRMKLLGWQAKTSLEEGLHRTYDWYREFKG